MIADDDRHGNFPTARIVRVHLWYATGESGSLEGGSLGSTPTIQRNIEASLVADKKRFYLSSNAHGTEALGKTRHPIPP